MVDGKVEEIKGVVRDKLIKEFQKKKKGWRINHHKAMSWLLNNVGSMVSAQLAKFGLAHEAWEYLKETHMMKDVAHKWNVQLKISKLQQGDKYIKDYYGRSLNYGTNCPYLSQNGRILKIPCWGKNYSEEDKFCTFLMGLKAENDTVKTSLLRGPSVPSVKEALSELIMEENWLLLIPKFKDHSVWAKYWRLTKKLCHHCHEAGHIKPKCPKLRRDDKRPYAADFKAAAAENQFA